MADRTPAPLRAVGVLLRALLGLAALAALVGGAPYLLMTVGHQPTELSGGLELLMAPDDGTLLLVALTCVGWVGWAAFTFSVLVEIVAVARRRSAPRIKGLGGLQSLAGFLIGGIVLLTPTAASAATPGPAVTATAVHTADDSVAAAAPTAAAPTAAEAVAADDTSGPQHTVTSATELPWDLAETYLGDGRRWQDIAALNPGIPQLAAGDQYLPQGAVIKLPADARPARPATDAAPAADNSTVQASQRETSDSRHGPRDRAVHKPADAMDTSGTDRPDRVTVRAGDSLWSIADTYGDPADWKAIYQANKGKPLPGGGTFDDPHLIFPGQKLDLPGASSPHRPGDDAAGRHDSSGAGDQHDRGPADAPPTGADAEETGPGAGGQGADAGKETTTPAPDASGTPSAAPTTPTRPAPQDHPAQAAEAVGENVGEASALSTAVAATSLFAASVLAVLGGRRALQQRRRRPRRRIPLPDPATAAADLEKQLRVDADLDGLDLVNRALRTLAANCVKASQPLPPLDAVRVTARGLELYLAAPTPPIAPFSELTEHPDRWWCPARGANLLDGDAARDLTAPYPALVSLGQTEDGDPVLVNLESVGLLRLTGSSTDVRAVVLGMAVELASSGLSDDATVVLAGIGEDLAAVFPVRISHHPDLGAALPDLRGHDALQRSALAAGDFDSLSQARLAADGGDTWVPTILLSPDAASGRDAEELAELLASRPQTASAVVAAAGDELDLPGAWTLSAAPGAPVPLPGLDLAVVLQRLEQGTYQQLLHLLATAARTDDAPAPAWTRAPHGDPAADGPIAVPDGGNPAVPRGADTDAVQEPVDTPDPADADRASLVAAVPSSSALSPAVTGAQAPPTEPDAAPRPEPVDDGAEDTRERDVFDQALQEVLAERGHDAPGSRHDSSPAPDATGADEDLEPPADEEGAELSPARGRPTAAEAAQRPAPRVTAVTSSVLAALNTPPDPPPAPQIRVLGPVDVVGALGKVESNRRNGLTEIAAWLVLHPGKSRHELDEAIWPGQRVRADTRNTHISKLRTWLGRDPLLPADDPHGAYLPPIRNGVYAFSDQVTSDWSQFQELYRQGMHRSGTEADIALAQALALVRGRPFSDIDQSKYTWAEYDIQEMISAIVDVAHELATRRLAVRDYRAAIAAASKGLTCDQQAELLYRDLFAIYSETGDRQGLERTVHQLSRIAAETGCDSAPETVTLINALMEASRIASA